MNPGNCRSCGAPILWAETERGGVMPLDAEPCEDGNVVLADGKARVVAASLFEPPPEGPRYRPHWASCPQADKHRKRR